MAKRNKKQQADQPPSEETALGSTQHMLLVYKNLGRRYRPPGVLLMVMGLFAFAPTFIGDLQNDLFEPAALAGVGAVLVLAGLGFWLFSALAMRRSYVQCQRDLLVIRSPFYRTLLSYRRISAVRVLPISKLIDQDKLKGLGKALVGPLVGGMAIVVYVNSWPTPKRWLKRFHSPYLFTREGEGWVFIVPNYSTLMREIEEFQQRKQDEIRGLQEKYEDPIDRLKYFQQ
jgi:hypothetical protein